MSRMIDIHQCSPTHQIDEVRTCVRLFLFARQLQKFLAFIVSVLVFAAGSFLSAPVEAGCGLYLHHGSDVRLVRTSEILNNSDMGPNTYRQFFELLQGQWGLPEPLCSGPNCGRPRIPFPRKDLASDLVIRTNLGVACGLCGERLKHSMESTRTVFSDSCHCLDGFLSSIEHPPRIV